MSIQDKLEYLMHPQDRHRFNAIDDSEPEPVDIEKPAAVQGANNEILRGRTAWTYKSDHVKIVTKSAVSDGNFNATVTPHNSGVICDTCMISAPPNGIMYCISFGRGVSYESDGFNTVQIPYAEIYVCNVPGTTYNPTVVRLPRRRHSCEVGIWSPQNVPSGATFKLNLIWTNLDIL